MQHKFLYESALCEEGYIVDEEGNRFIDELKPRDEVSRAIYEKLQNNQEVFLDVRHLGLEKSMKPSLKKDAWQWILQKLNSKRSCSTLIPL